MATNQTVLTMDFLPTFLDFIGKKPEDKNLDGISIKELLLNNKALPQRYLFWSYSNRNAVRSANWKMVSIKDGDKESMELYDIANDVNEKNNLAVQNPEVVKNMKEKLLNWKVEVEYGVEIISN